MKANRPGTPCTDRKYPHKTMNRPGKQTHPLVKSQRRHSIRTATLMATRALETLQISNPQITETYQAELPTEHQLETHRVQHTNKTDVFSLTNLGYGTHITLEPNHHYQNVTLSFLYDKDSLEAQRRDLKAISSTLTIPLNTQIEQLTLLSITPDSVLEKFKIIIPLPADTPPESCTNKWQAIQNYIENTVIKLQFNEKRFTKGILVRNQTVTITLNSKI